MKLKNKVIVFAAIILVAILIWAIIYMIKASKPLPKFVLGKGMWVYHIGSCEHGNIGKMVCRAKWAGLDYVIIKTHDGSGWVSYNDRVKAKQLLDALHTAGIKAYAWGYVYSKKPEAEANLAIEALEMGFDGYFWNAEIHMKNHPKAADTMCKMVREYVDAKCPQKVLGYSTFCRIQNQSGLPLEVYDKYSDVAMPQVYFSWFKGWSPKSAAAKTMNIWMTAQASWGHVAKPLIPTLESSNGTADMPETSSVDLTDAAKGFHGYFGVNFYSWDVANDDLWKVIRNAPGNLSYQRQKNAAKARALAHGEPLP